MKSNGIVGMDEQELVFRVVFPGQVTSKKNSRVASINQRTGKLFFRQSDIAKQQEVELIKCFQAGFMESGINKGVWDNPERKFTVKIRVFNKDNRRHDLDNQISTILDALVKSEILRDDDQNTVTIIAAIYKGLDRDNPRAEIEIIGGLQNGKN